MPKQGSADRREREKRHNPKLHCSLQQRVVPPYRFSLRNIICTCAPGRAGFAENLPASYTRRYVCVSYIASRQHSFYTTCLPTPGRPYSADAKQKIRRTAPAECSALLGSPSLTPSRFPGSQIIAPLPLLTKNGYAMGS